MTSFPTAAFLQSLACSAAAVVVVLATTFVVAKIAGKHSVIDTAWGLLFAVIAIAGLVSSAGHGDGLRQILGQSLSDLATSEAIQRNYTAALAHYQEAEKWNPDISGLYKNLGQCAFRVKNYPEAVRGLSRAVASEPDDHPQRAMLGGSARSAVLAS